MRVWVLAACVLTSVRSVVMCAVWCVVLCCVPTCGEATSLLVDQVLHIASLATHSPQWKVSTASFRPLNMGRLLVSVL